MKEAIEVVAHSDAAGTIIPRAFVWRGEKRPILSLGRQWVQDGNRHFLVMTREEHVYELAYRPAEMKWYLLRDKRDFGGRSTFV